jgi:hypothetical protein
MQSSAWGELGEYAKQGVTFGYTGVRRTQESRAAAVVAALPIGASRVRSDATT